MTIYIKLLFLLIVLMFFPQIVSAFLFLPFLEDQNLPSISINRLSSSITFFTSFLLITLFFRYFYRIHIKIDKVTVKKSLLYFVAGISLKIIPFFILGVFLFLLFYFSLKFLTPEILQDVSEAYQEISGGYHGVLTKFSEASIQNYFTYDYLIYAFAAVIITPITEELIFRGFALKYLLNKGKSKVWTVVFTSIVFGLLHIDRGWDHGVFTGAFSILACFIYLKERNLVYSIIAHSSANFLATLVVIINPYSPNEAENSLNGSFKCNNHTQANTIIQTKNPLVGRWESIDGTIDNKAAYTKEGKRVKYYHSDNTYHVDKVVDGVEKTFIGGNYKLIDANNYKEIID